MEFLYEIQKPEKDLSDFVESFWRLENPTKESQRVIIFPDGRFDIFFSYSENEPYHVSISELGTSTSEGLLPAKSVMYAISFKLLALLDALELSECLTSENFTDLKIAIELYENGMRKRASKTAQMTMEQTDSMDSPEGLANMVAMFSE